MKHGMSYSGEYRIWQLMKNRCTNPNDARWVDYGGRGISIDPAWLKSFEAFYQDMGQRPTVKHSLDRVDVNGPYTKANCRWATMTEQNRNRRNNKLDEVAASQIRWLCTDGGFSQSEVGRAFNVSQGLVWHIINNLTWAV